MANTKIPSELIADSSITAAKLADGTITTADIADSNVTTAKIADSNVTTAKIGDAQVTTAKITDANVTTGKIADDAVTTAKMASNSVTSDTIASGITLAGTTTLTSHLVMGDGDIIKLGNGADSELYFDGNSTLLRNTAASTGYPIYIQGGAGTGANIYLQAVNGTNGLRVETSGKVAAYYGANERLYTTSTGAGVTGNLTVTGTVDGVDIATRDAVLTSTTTTAGAALPKAGGTMSGALIVDAGNSGLDIRLGTDKRVTWSGGIGEIGNTAGFQAINTAGSALAPFGIRATELKFATGSATRLTIDSSGNATFAGNVNGAILKATSKVAAGNLSQTPVASLDVGSTDLGLPPTSGSGFTGLARIGYTDRTWTGSEMIFGIINSGSTGYAGYIQQKQPQDQSVERPLLLNPQGGNIGIGTTAPGQKLHVSGNIELNSISTASSGDMDKILFRKAHTSGASTGLYDMAELRSYTSNGYAGGLDFYTGRSTGGGNYSSTFAMRINEEGSVGIGTTSPATSAKGLHVVHDANEGTPSFPDGEVIIAQRNFNSSQGCHIGIIAGSASESAINFGDKDDSDIGNITYNHAANRMEFITNAAERMRIDNSGNLMMGGTNPAPVSNNVVGLSLRAVNGEIQASVNGAPALYLNRLNNDGQVVFFRKDGTTCGSIATKSGSNGGNNTIVVACQNTGLRFDDPNDAIYPTDDAGLLVNNTIDLGQSGAAFNEFYTTKQYLNVAGANNGGPEALHIYGAGSGGGYGINIKCIGTGGGTMLRFNTAGNIVGQIYTSSSATTYATSSDYRLKENVDYTWDATTRLKQLKPARFNFIVDDTNTLVDGFLAHEVQGIVPEAIKGEKDGDEMQCIDHSKLVPLLVKTIQELEARIATLEG